MTKIIIYISPEVTREDVFLCIVQTFEFMPGWTVHPNVASPLTSNERIYAFDLDNHTFSFWRSLLDTDSNPMESSEMMIINNLADISHLLNFIYDNEEILLNTNDTGKLSEDCMIGSMLMTEPYTLVGGEKIKFKTTYSFKLTNNGPEHKVKFYPSNFSMELDKVMAGESDAQDVYAYYNASNL